MEKFCSIISYAASKYNIYLHISVFIYKIFFKYFINI